MMNKNIKLVLNVDTPNYFQKATHHTTVKRPLNEPFATISVKKRRLTQSVGNAFRKSTKVHKLKIGSAINSVNKFNLQKKHENLLSATQINFDDENDPSSSSALNKSLHKVSRHTSKNSRNVSFSSKIEVLESNINKDETLREKTNFGNKQAPKKPISSLFKHNPDIPVLEKSDNVTHSQQLFSDVPFRELEISPKLVADMEKLDYTTLTLVQHYSIPLILKGKDVLIKSQTGSGKTMAYALPIVHKLMTMEPKLKRNDGLYALIIVPTRELAVQTHQCIEKLCNSCIWVVPGYLIGGEKKKSEKSRLRKGINILVATPGRLIDHINNTNSLSFEKLQFLVLDEADRMFDLGYEKNINSILFALNEKEEISEKRQTIMLSATLTSAVQKLAGITLKSAQTVDVTAMQEAEGGDISTLSDSKLVIPQNLKNYYMLVPTKLRLVTLAAFILAKCKFTNEKKILIFMTTQDMIDYHSSLLAQILPKLGKVQKRSKIEVEAEKILAGKEIESSDDELEEVENEIQLMKLHGNMAQPERTAVFNSFHKASSGVLLSTDVASRGIDLPSVNWIVQFNPAVDSAEFVHRVGRTARIDKVGSAVVFVTPAETSYISMLETHGINFSALNMADVLQTLKKSSLYDLQTEKVPHNMEVAATRLQDKFENCVESDRKLKDLAIQGYVSFIRSYASIPKAAREYFCFRLLHLGHTAKSYALRDPPGVLGAKGTKGFQKKEGNFRPKDRFKKKSKGDATDKHFMTPKRVVSEFDAGFVDDLPPTKRANKKRKSATKGKIK